MTAKLRTVSFINSMVSTTSIPQLAGDDGDDDGVVIDCSSFQSDIAKLALFFFGTIGNVLSLIVMRKQSVHARSYALALTVLTILNSLSLMALALDSLDQILISVRILRTNNFRQTLFIYFSLNLDKYCNF